MLSLEMLIAKTAGDLQSMGSLRQIKQIFRECQLLTFN
jgi:hypothetical protein